MNLVLANVDYSGADGLSGGHTSDEGHQLQQGLAHCGWMLAGTGYNDGCRDVPALIQRYQPRLIFIADPRDWDPKHPGSFRKDVGFHDIDALKRHPEIFRAIVIKDAGSVRDYQRQMFQRIGADAAVVYYHPDAVRRLNPWLSGTTLIRTWHSVDRATCEAIDLRAPRKRAVVTGATSRVYPLRTEVMRAALADRSLGIDVYGHPGYHNRGHHTPEYMRVLAGYRVHVATASRFGFALRKIIESVAMGCTPVTNLPDRDELPEIDGALLRVSPQASVREVLEAVEAADRAWNLEERLAWAEKAQQWYDWRLTGKRLSTALEEAAVRARGSVACSA